MGTKQSIASYYNAEVPSLRESTPCSHGGLSICATAHIVIYFLFIPCELTAQQCCVAWGRRVISYRRGFKAKVWEKYWHWHPQCEAYPTSNCIMQKDKPSDDQLCGRCQALSREKH